MQPSYIFILIIVSLMLIFLYLIEPFLTKQKITNNNEHGSARWSTKQEIYKNFTKEKVSSINESGFPVYYSKNNKYVWFDTNTPHWIYLGSTGSGKSVTAVIPQCSFIATAKNKKSVFITDPKGEIFHTTSKMFSEQGYKILSLDFRNPSLSNHLNILEPIIKEYEAYIKNKKLANQTTSKNKNIRYQNLSIEHLAECNQLIGSLSTMIMEDKTAKEAFWNNSASDLLYGIISLFLEDYADGKIKREQITLSSIKKFQNSSMAVKNLKTLIKYVEAKPYGLKSKDKLIPIITTSENTYKSITSIFNERMTLFDDINVENITSDSDFEFDILGKQPTVLYCCIPDESKIYYSLVSIIVSLIYKTLVLLCNSQPNKRLTYDLVFLLDEFANTPPLSDIETIVSVARSRGMHFQFFLQSFAQLDNLYGKEVSQIIQDNCGLAYLKTNTQETAESISKRLGNKTIETTSLNYSLSFTKAEKRLYIKCTDKSYNAFKEYINQSSKYHNYILYKKEIPYKKAFSKVFKEEEQMKEQNNNAISGKKEIKMYDNYVQITGKLSNIGKEFIKKDGEKARFIDIKQEYEYNGKIKYNKISVMLSNELINDILNMSKNDTISIKGKLHSYVDKDNNPKTVINCTDIDILEISKNQNEKTK